MARKLPHSIFYPIVIFLAFCLYYSLALFIPFFTRGEAREALVVQAMFDQANLILPLRNGADIPSKPPFFHWCSYFSAVLFGFSEFSIRLPSAIAASIGLSFFYFVFARRKSPNAALLGSFFLASSLLWGTTAIVSRVDMMFTLWVSLSTWLLFEWSEKRASPFVVLTTTGVCLACAVLTKGPAGLVLPGVVFAIYFVLFHGIRRLPVLSGIYLLLIALALSGAWYYAAYLEAGHRFLDVQLMKENLARVVPVEGYENGHEGGGPLIVVPMLLSAFFPWSLLFPLAGAVLWNKRKRILKEDPALGYCFIWILTYLLFFSFTVSKRNVYFLPMFPALTYMLLGTTEENWKKFPKTLGLTKFLLSLVSIALLTALTILFGFHFIDVSNFLLSLRVKPHDVETAVKLSSLPFLTITCLASSVFLFTAGALLFFRNRLYVGLYAQSMALLLFMGIANVAILPRIAAIQSPKSELLEFSPFIPSGSNVGQFRQDLYAVDFYLHRTVPTVLSENDMQSANAHLVFVSEEDLADAQSALGTCETKAVSRERILYGKAKLFLLECL